MKNRFFCFLPVEKNYKILAGNFGLKNSLSAQKLLTSSTSTTTITITITITLTITIILKCIVSIM